MDTSRIVGTAILGCMLALALLPTLFAYLGKKIGSIVRSRGQSRRELLLDRARSENAGRQQQAKSRSLNDSDEEWEKVGDGARTPMISTWNESAKDTDFSGVIGFFHPFCNAGGGGERVLFAAIQATQQRYPNALCVVYTGDQDAPKDVILENCHNRFNIGLNPSCVEFLYLSTRDWVLASRWPHFTLLGQSLGSIVLAWDAFNLIVPDVFIDTMGYAFALWLSKWLFPTVTTAAYVHYPTISTDMLASLYEEVASNSGLNAGLGKGVKGQLKQLYWKAFAKLYGFVGGSVDVVMTNSTWTRGHITSLWSKARQTRRKQHPISVVYPPCAVAELSSKIPLDTESESRRTKDILYIAQFRPEKMHGMVIDAFNLFLKSLPSNMSPLPRLVLVGSVRDDGDEKRVYKLRLQAHEIQDNVEFRINAKWNEVLDLLQTSAVGVNGMWNEHFGIGVVEYQAAGLICVVNDSGGPKYDIVVPVDGQPSGFHASTIDDFAEGFRKAFELSPEDTTAMRLRARKSAQRFSEEVFREAWTTHLERLISGLQ